MRQTAMSPRFPPHLDEIELRLCMPVDPLTRLMMDADGVSASEMEVLLRRVSQAMAVRSGRGGGFVDHPPRMLGLPACVLPTPSEQP